MSDINDCTPTFATNEYVISVVENVAIGSSIEQLTAGDCDVGNNGNVVYSVTSGALAIFSIEADSGVIRTLAALDFEQVKSYQLAVQAVDMATIPLTGYTTVTVSVTDFNDCPPVFNVIDDPEIEEDQGVGSLLATFSVNDCDSGINGLNGTRFTIVAGM